MRVFVLVSAVISLFSGTAQALSGAASVHDGDTLRIGSQNVRLWGIDAPELEQACGAKPCGMEARAALGRLIAGAPVTCTPKGRSYKRLVAQCSVNGRDLGAAMIRAGHAVEAARYSRGHYRAEEALARGARRGLWGQNAQNPADWRAFQKFRRRFAQVAGRIVPYDAAMAQAYVPRLRVRGLAAVHRAVNALPYRPDSRIDQVLDADGFWRHGGDCDKFALVKMLELKAQGFEGLAYLVLKDGPGGDAHAVVAAPMNGRMVALDNRLDAPVPLETLYRDYTAAYFIDGADGTVWKAKNPRKD